MPPQEELFERKSETIALGPGAVVLTGFAHPIASELLVAIAGIARISPFRHMVTPRGSPMSAEMTNCGQVGWLTDLSGYRYDARDPQTSKPWPELPPLFLDLARRAAAGAGFLDFVPDACLVNRYAPGARLSIHQDRDEQDYGQPIVSVSLGLPATFLFGGLKRSDRVKRFGLHHGDVVVWGGPSRLVFHGVDSLDGGEHPATGRFRYNLTFRRAL
jgi:DNA oxidative demethylase